MTLILGTKIISERILRSIIQVVKPEDTPDVKSITLRWKKDIPDSDEDFVHGNWGKFYPVAYRITLCVPSFTKEFTGTAPYSRLVRIINNDLEWYALVIGHEYYHAWQWTHEKEFFHCDGYREVGAEKYEQIALEKWRTFMEEQRQIAATYQR